jgi:hypothetical protein
LPLNINAILTQLSKKRKPLNALGITASTPLNGLAEACVPTSQIRETRQERLCGSLVEIETQSRWSLRH